MTHVVLRVDGMSCSHCLDTVNRALAGVTGLVVRSVTLGAAEMDLEVPGPTPDEVIAVLAEAGYPATVVTAQ